MLSRVDRNINLEAPRILTEEEKKARHEVRKIKQRANAKARYMRDPEKYKAIARNSRERILAGKSPEEIAQIKRELQDVAARWYRKTKETNPERLTNARLKRQYGLDLNDLAAMLHAQGYKCAICAGRIDEITRKIDHDHQTGEVRELLCHNCNVVLGLIDESVSTLESAITYLQGHRRKRAEVS